MTHSLSAAVADGTISDRTAWEGLLEADVRKMARKHGESFVAVYFGDYAGNRGKKIMRVRELVHDLRRDGRFLCDNGSLFYSEHIHRIYPVIPETTVPLTT